MTSLPPRSRKTAVAVLSTAVLALTACGTTASDGDDDPHGAEGAVTVQNCGADVTFESEPQRLVLLKSASVPALHDLGVLDRAVARAGAFPEEYYDHATQAELSDIPQLTADTDATGHLQISKDVVIAQDPDVVFGEVENLPREGLGELGIPVLEEPLFCATDPDSEPDFESVYEQIALYGDVFNRAERAEDVIADLEDRVEAARAEASSEERRTAALLYPTVGGGTTYAYGAGSMPQAQLDAAGLTNVFGNQPQRVFEVTAEQLLGTDPDVLILLHSSGEPEPVEDAVRALPGAGDLTAVQDDAIMTQLLNYSEPATPLAVEGLEQIVERFGR